MLDLVEEILIIINNDIVSIPRTRCDAMRRVEARFLYLWMNEWMDENLFGRPLQLHHSRFMSGEWSNGQNEDT